jgi:Leucine-rich repeat (LRR) protein
MNRSLKNLDVSNNQIEIIEDLKKLKDLETLDVSNNKINQWTQIVCFIYFLIVHLFSY